MLFVTTHSSTNVRAYSDAGALLTSEVLQGGPPLSELRGIALVSDTVLWVASGSQSDSVIAAFVSNGGAGTSYAYHEPPIAELGQLGSLLHPFDFTLDGSDCYVSNQDTNVVVHLSVADDYLSATAAGIAPALTTAFPKGDFLPATFVASSQVVPSAPSVTPVPTPAGLEVSFSGGSPSNSVRGVLCSGGSLYVADEVANVVKVYDSEGKYVSESNALTSGGPVHLLVADDVLYVANGNQVFSSALGSALQLDPVAAIDVPDVSGMALGADSEFFAGSRNPSAPKVYQYSGFPTDTQFVASWDVTGDVPEFVLYVPDPIGAG